MHWRDLWTTRGQCHGILLFSMLLFQECHTCAPHLHLDRCLSLPFASFSGMEQSTVRPLAARLDESFTGSHSAKHENHTTYWVHYYSR
ncbi:hypothetical protein F5Y09DRAFT_326050 [Xylaria sp. FL1042]|nr:hypothetical protein F5Y09DRAFT_326050 [Xylaria sp. FL1042]